MQAKRGAGSRHTSRNIGGRVTHPAKEKKPPQATEGGQCAIGMQAATPMSDRVVTSHTHTHITTPTHQVTTLQGMEALERGRDAAALDNSLAPVPHIPTSTHHPTKLPPCKGMKRDAAPPHQAAALNLVPVATHTAPGTSPHRVTTEGGHWHRRAICLQCMEALEPPRHHHRAIRMQHHTPSSRPR